jgi:hypothetical protein
LERRNWRDDFTGTMDSLIESVIELDGWEIIEELHFLELFKNALSVYFVNDLRFKIPN